MALWNRVKVNCPYCRTEIYPEPHESGKWIKCLCGKMVRMPLQSNATGTTTKVCAGVLIAVGLVAIGYLSAGKGQKQYSNIQNVDIQTSSANSSQSMQDEKEEMVYITKSGKKYHKDGCSSLSKSKIPISKEEAVKKGYTPCSRCKP